MAGVAVERSAGASVGVGGALGGAVDSPTVAAVELGPAPAGAVVVVWLTVAVSPPALSDSAGVTVGAPDPHAAQIAAKITTTLPDHVRSVMSAL